MTTHLKRHLIVSFHGAQIKKKRTYISFPAEHTLNQSIRSTGPVRRMTRRRCSKIRSALRGWAPRFTCSVCKGRWLFWTEPFFLPHQLLYHRSAHIALTGKLIHGHFEARSWPLFKRGQLLIERDDVNMPSWNITENKSSTLRSSRPPFRKGGAVFISEKVMFQEDIVLSFHWVRNYLTFRDHPLHFLVKCISTCSY